METGKENSLFHKIEVFSPAEDADAATYCIPSTCVINSSEQYLVHKGNIHFLTLCNCSLDKRSRQQQRGTVSAHARWIVPLGCHP